MAADVTHPAVEANQALAERRLATARLAGQAHDLAVRHVERDAVERFHVAREGAVVDAEVFDVERHRCPTSPAASG